MSEKTNNLSEDVFFFGEFDRSLDAQKRIQLPSEWRNSGEIRLFLLPREADLLLFPFETFQEFLLKARKYAFSNKKLQLVLEQIGRIARDCRSDKQGRIKFDERTLEKANIDGDMKLIGALTHIRICAPGSDSLDIPMDIDECLRELQKVSENGADLASILGLGPK